MPDFQQLFGWAFVGLGSYWFCWSVVKLIQGTRSARWPCVMGEVKSSEILTRSDSGDGPGVEHSPRIYYSYMVNGAKFENESGIHSVFEEWGDHENAEFEIRKYGRLPDVRVFYDPRNPSRSLLKTGVPPSYYWMPPFCLFLAAIGFAMTGVWRLLG